MPTLHYAANGNWDGPGGNVTTALLQDGFNLIDTSSAGDLAYLPAGTKALYYLGSTAGVTSSFISQMTALEGQSNLYGVYLDDEPGAGQAAGIEAEAQWIHQNMPGVKTFLEEQNLSAPDTPSYAYGPSNTPDVDLYGIDPYPFRAAGFQGGLSVINDAVTAIEGVGVPAADIVPTFQSFGGTSSIYPSYVLPTADQENQILSTWNSLLPNPQFDYAYSWGQQGDDSAIVNTPYLGTLLTEHNDASNTVVIINTPLNQTVNGNNVSILSNTGNHGVFITGNDDTLTETSGIVTAHTSGQGPIYVMPVAGTATLHVQDANVLTDGTVFDLTSMLDATSWNGDLNTLSNFMRVAVTPQGDTNIDIDKTGVKNAGWVNVGQLHQVATDFNTFVSHSVYPSE